MQFEFSSKYKMIAGVLMAIGAASIGYGFSQGDATRSWASLLLGNHFFLYIALTATFFLAVQYVAEVAWSVVIKRILMSFAPYLAIAVVLMIVIYLAGGHSIYHWMHEELYDPNSPEYDEILAGKSGYLNFTFFTIRLVAYAAIWAGFAYLMRKTSLSEDQLGGEKAYNKGVKLAAIFLVLFAVSSSTSAWDLIMSIDAHWFSTLFGWYHFASAFVTALSVLALVTIHLKRRGFLPHVNENHIHDIGKFMFAFSIFWTYLWFSQFMLYWYANLPEEVVYYMFRQEHYLAFFIGNLFLNFAAPFLIMMTRDAKRKENAVFVAAIFVIIGHWFDFFQMIMPGTVGEHWHMGVTEVGTSLFFAGLFFWVLFATIAKTPLVPKQHPFLDESLHHHV